MTAKKRILLTSSILMFIKNLLHQLIKWIPVDSSHNHWKNFREHSRRVISFYFPAVWETCKWFTFQGRFSLWVSSFCKDSDLSVLKLSSIVGKPLRNRRIRHEEKSPDNSDVIIESYKASVCLPVSDIRQNSRIAEKRACISTLKNTHKLLC